MTSDPPDLFVQKFRFAKFLCVATPEAWPVTSSSAKRGYATEGRTFLSVVNHSKAIFSLFREAKKWTATLMRVGRRRK